MKSPVHPVVRALALWPLLIAAVLYFAINHVLPYSPIRPHRCSRKETVAYLPHGTASADLALQMVDFNVTVDNSLLLKGWFVCAKSRPPRGTLVLLHGIASCKEAMLNLAEALSTEGYNSILYDSRAHGESGGYYCTFGYYEKDDVSHYIDESLRRFKNVEPIGIFGNSLGAAVALQATALDKRIQCGIVESPFANLRDVVNDALRRISGVSFRFISDMSLDNSGKIAQFDVDAVNPEQAAKLIYQPVLLIHGLKDRHNSVEHGKRIFKNLASPFKEWYQIDDGDHYNLARAGGAEYQSRVRRFLRTHLNN